MRRASTLAGRTGALRHAAAEPTARFGEPRRHAAPRAALLILAVALAACGGSSTGSTGGGGVVAPPEECAESYPSTFAAIEEMIFERHGCTQDVCHGSGKSGGLDLRPGVAFANLLDVPSLGSSFKRVVPGDRERSLLWRKLAAATLPGSVEISGAAMPSGLPALSEDELELVRLWIYGGAPETGTVANTEDLVDGCLPPLEPITIKPLEPPPPGEGIQLALPEWDVPAGSEHEVCFASYYDVSAQVPAEFRDASGRMLRYSLHEMRQDPQSHHLILNFATIDPEQLDDPSFGEWKCRGGEHAGQACEPTDLTQCGSGLCASDPKPTFACLGYGPPEHRGLLAFRGIGGAQQSQARIQLHEGVFAQIPLKGVLYWNSHAFNLTQKTATMHARLNYHFASDRRFPAQAIFDASKIFSANAEPYTTQTICHDHVLPKGARLFELNSHTHARGKHFTVDLNDGRRIYESFVYNDPTYQRFDPPLAFDSDDAATRTLHFCGLFNNGMNPDGSPNPDEVTRASRVPQSPGAASAPGQCSPVACAAGNVGAACSGVDDDAACDSSAGAGDGSCDACRITGGESTENEMFILIGQYFIDPAVGVPPDDDGPTDLIPFP